MSRRVPEPAAANSTSMPVTAMTRRTRSATGSPRWRRRSRSSSASWRKPGPGLGRVAQLARAPRRRPAGQQLGRIGCPGELVEVLVERRRDPHRHGGTSSPARPSGELLAHAGQQPQVARADPPARAAEQVECGAVGGRVLEDPQDVDDRADLRAAQQALQADDLDRDALRRAGRRRAGWPSCCRGSARRSSASAPRPPPAWAERTRAGSAAISSTSVSYSATSTRPGPAPGRTVSGSLPGGRLVERSGERVGEVEDLLARAAC